MKVNPASENPLYHPADERNWKRNRRAERVAEKARHKLRAIGEGFESATSVATDRKRKAG